jgi:hypothetical protein
VSLAKKISYLYPCHTDWAMATRLTGLHFRLEAIRTYSASYPQISRIQYPMSRRTDIAVTSRTGRQDQGGDPPVL